MTEVARRPRLNAFQRGWVIGISGFVLGCGFMYDYQPHTEPQPAAVTPAPTSTHSTRPEPQPTVTVTAPARVEVPESCIRMADKSAQMRDASYKTSTQFGRMTRYLDQAVLAVYDQDLPRINKQIENIQKADDILSKKAQRLVTLDGEFEVAMKQCNQALGR